MKRILITFLCICVIGQIWAKYESYDEVKKMLTEWMNNVTINNPSKNDKYKEISFPKSGYIVKCYCNKGFPSPNTVISISDLQGNIIVEGTTSIGQSTHELQIKGIYSKPYNGITVHHYGLFSVSNTQNNEFVLKEKKAENLFITPITVNYYEGYYVNDDFPAIVKMDLYSPVVAIKGVKDFSFLSFSVSPNVLTNNNYDDVPSLLLYSTSKVFLTTIEGDIFQGKLEDKKRKDNGFISYTFGEGMKTQINSQHEQLELHQSGDSVSLTIINKDIPFAPWNEKKQVLYINKDSISPLSKYWDVLFCYKSCNRAYIEYANGNSFSGKVEFAFTRDSASVFIPTKLGYGIYKYSNGDYFEGNCAGATIGSFFVDGITSLNPKNGVLAPNNSKLKGNWLNEFTITKSQLEDVSRENSPSQAYKKALQYERENEMKEFHERYIDYEYISIGRPTYFNPSTGYVSQFHGTFMTYDKKSERYRWHHTYECAELNNNDDVQVIFALNSDGTRKWEIVCEKEESSHKYKPKYINQFTWYINGEIESIKSYDYDSKKIVLACFFFTDGVLRSAYSYGLGNNGENVLRMSKEAHPTFGGYICKQYDFNGKYEREIDWNIGYYNMAPSLYDLSKNYRIIDRFNCK